MRKSIQDIIALERDYLTPAEIAGVLGSDPQTIRVAARTEPKRLGFPVVVIGSRVKIPRTAFLRYMGVEI
jgi:hypothetical protein